MNLPAESFFVLYLVQNASSADFLARKQGSRASKPAVFFSILAANFDHFDHVRWPSANQFAFEDFARGGDRDFTDLVARFDFVGTAGT